MKTFTLNKTKWFILFYIFFLMASGNSQPKLNLNETGSDISNEVTQSVLTSNPFFKTAKRARVFRLNPYISRHQGLTIGNKIQLQLFNGKSYDAVIQNITTDVNRVTAITLKLSDYKFASGYVIISENSYLITVDIPELDEHYKTNYDQSKEIYLFQLDESKIEQPNCGNLGIATNDNNKAESTKIQNRTLGPSPTCLTLPSTADPAIVDILIVYTSAAETWANTNEGSINNTIAAAIAKANEVSTNNSLGITFQLAHSELIDYTENTAGSDLSRLQGNSDGYMDDVHALRATYDADLVSLFSYLTGDGIAGIANLLTTQYGNPRAGFSNVKVNNASNTYTFPHELAHNFGADHYRYQNSSAGPTVWVDWPENDWSSGWRFQGSDTKMYGTVMTYTSTSLYNDKLPTTTIPYFSDPTLTYLGATLGDVAEADNSRTLKEIKHYIARYSNAAPYCIAEVSSPTAFYITNVTMGDINHTSTYSLYSDLTTLATCMELGETQSFSSQIYNSASSNRLKIWVDWNDDKTFDEATELVYASNAGPISGVFSSTITAPTDPGLVGEKRMRIRIYDPTSPNPNNTPCGNSTFGEIEDYTINLTEKLNTKSYILNPIVIYPNPTSKYINIKTEAVITKVEIYNLLGEKIMDYNNQNQIDVGNFKSAIYIVKIYSDKGQETKRFIKM